MSNQVGNQNVGFLMTWFIYIYLYMLPGRFLFDVCLISPYIFIYIYIYIYIYSFFRILFSWHAKALSWTSVETPGHFDEICSHSIDNVLTLNVPNIIIAEQANTVDPGEMAHNELYSVCPRVFEFSI